MQPGQRIELARSVCVRSRAGKLVLPAGRRGRVAPEHVEGGCWVLAIFRAAGQRLRIWLRPEELQAGGAA